MDSERWILAQASASFRLVGSDCLATESASAAPVAAYH
jgi:hypothetical protein